jgi:hypothetical protein
MTPVLAVAVIAAQALDALTWALMPAGAETNPLVHGLHSPTAWGLKALLVVAALALQVPLRPKYAWAGDLLIVASLFAGFTGAGSNVSVLVVS